jgi:ATP-dependent DNA helicase RecG
MGDRRVARAARERAGSPPVAPRAAPAGQALRAKLAKLGVRSDFDLVLHLPLRYEDETVLTPIAAARSGAAVLVEGDIVSSEVAYRPRRQLVLKVRDASGVVFVRFLNFYPSQTKTLAAGRRVRLFGEVRPGFFGGEMVHPRYRIVHGGEPLPTSLTPVYPTTAGV